MVSLLASSVVDSRFEPRLDYAKNYAISICCFSVKYAVLRNKSKDGLAGNQVNVFDWRDISTRGLVSVV